VHFEDFILQLDASTRGGFRARVLKSPFGEGAVSFSLPAAVAGTRREGDPPGASARDLGYPAARPEVGELSPIEIGTEMYRTVFQGPVRSLFDKSRGQVERSPQLGLRLKIKVDPGDPDTAALAGLPWELLCDGETEDFFALSRQTSLVRYLDVPRMSQPISFTPPLRILAVSASPKALPSLDLAEEARRLEALRHAGFEVQHLVNASAGAIREALASDPWNVLHFMGHGHFDPATGDGMLAFEGAGGRLDPVSGKAFATKLKDFPSLGVVVLNACNTARAGHLSGVNPFHGVATALVLGGIPAVVAMQRPISDRAALGFSAAFYRHLARGDSIDEALTEGRQAIHSAAPESFEWATPVLFLRIPEGNVFEARPAPAGRGLLPKVGAGAAAAGILIAGGLYLSSLRRSSQAPVQRTPLSGQTVGKGSAGTGTATQRDSVAPSATPNHAGTVKPTPVAPVQPALTTPQLGEHKGDGLHDPQRQSRPAAQSPAVKDSMPTAPADQAPADLSSLSAQAISIARRDGGGLRVTVRFTNGGNTPLSLILDNTSTMLYDDHHQSYRARRSSLPLAGDNPRLDLAAGASLSVQFDFPPYKPGSKTFNLALATAEDYRPINVSGNELTLADAP
jgi:hypothetical protein